MQALCERAARNGRSVEAEHRDILARALQRMRRRTVADVLATMPDLGVDADFARVEDSACASSIRSRAGARLTL